MVGMHYPGGSTTLGGNMIFDVIYTVDPLNQQWAIQTPVLLKYFIL